jgi:hypothetical protein
MSSSSQFRLIDHGWKAEFDAAAKLKATGLLVITPFIKHRPAQRLAVGKTQIRVLTRFSLRDFLEGVSDLSALRHLLAAGAEVRGIKNLHAKLYVFGGLRAIITSANLTEAALTRNHELGLVTNESALIGTCTEYFERLWALAGKHGKSLTVEMLKKWEAKIAPLAAKKSTAASGLRDYGADLGFMPDPPTANVEPSITTQAFVKFFGEGHKRIDSATPVIDEVDGSESHWALSYPNTKRPRQVSTGDVMFIGRMARPHDTLIYGRAIAYEHQPGRDDASDADKKRRDWKKQWGTYVRVRDPEFIAGTLANGISLSELMEKFGAEAFVSTDENKRQGAGNTDPRIALRSKAHMPLTQKAADWLNAKFYQALVTHGRIPISQLEKLHWPEHPIE